MRRYLVTFLKVVPDATGHDRQTIQHRTVVAARSEVAARFAAKAMFCEAAGIADWRMRADRCDILEWPAMPPVPVRQPAPTLAATAPA